MTASPAEAQGVETEAGRRSWRSLLLRWGATGALLALLFALIDVDDAVAAVVDADPGMLAAGFLVNFAGTIFLPGVITRLALSAQGRTMGLWRLIEINLTNRFYVLVLPRAASLAIRWYRYGEGSLSAEALALIMFERCVQLGVLLLLSLGALWLDRGLLGQWTVPLLLTALTGTVAVLAALLPFVSASTERLLGRLLRWASPILPGAICRRLERLVSAAAVFRELPRGPTLAIIGWSLLATLFFFASAWFAARSIGLEVSLLSLVWVRSLVFMMTLIPLTIGGIGVRELGFVGLLGLIGVSAPTALAFSAVNFAFQVAQGLIGALVECWRLVIAPLRSKQGHGAWQ